MRRALCSPIIILGSIVYSWWTVSKAQKAKYPHALILRHPQTSPLSRFLFRVLELRVDATFSPLLTQASEEIRRRVISVLTHGDSSGSGRTASAENNGGTTTTAGPTPDGPKGGAGGASASGNAGASGGAGLASVVELQEREIAGLREELSEALSRVPRGGGEGGGVSALEEALRNQVCIQQYSSLLIPPILMSMPQTWTPDDDCRVWN